MPIGKENDVLIIYRLLYDLPEEAENSIQLRMRIICSNGVLLPLPNLERLQHPNHKLALAVPDRQKVCVHRTAPRLSIATASLAIIYYFNIPIRLDWNYF